MFGDPPLLTPVERQSGGYIPSGRPGAGALIEAYANEDEGLYRLALCGERIFLLRSFGPSILRCTAHPCYTVAQALRTSSLHGVIDLHLMLARPEAERSMLLKQDEILIDLRSQVEFDVANVTDTLLGIDQALYLLLKTLPNAIVRGAVINADGTPRLQLLGRGIDHEKRMAIARRLLNPPGGAPTPPRATTARPGARRRTGRRDRQGGGARPSRRRAQGGGAERC